MLAYSFKQIQKANEVADAKELALRNYFSKFLTENPKANESLKFGKKSSKIVISSFSEKVFELQKPFSKIEELILS